MLPLRWNLSRHARTFRAADAFVVSIQKAGRTWVRVFLSAYFEEWQRHGRQPAPPSLHYTHDLWEYFEKVPRRADRLRGKWLIPPADAREKPKLLVARDPRDLMVSLYFHLTKRSHRFRGSLSELLRDADLGVPRVVTIMNRWLQEWADPLSAHADFPALETGALGARLHLLRYEDARRDPHAAFTGAVRFLLPTVEPDLAALERALELSSFENMRRLETQTQSVGAESSRLLARAGLDRGDALRPADEADADSFKTRRGKVGGYVDYLSAEDLAYLDAQIATLDPRYGYERKMPKDEGMTAARMSEA